MTDARILSDFDFFDEFDNSQLSMVGATSRQVHYPAGQTLFSEGAPASGCWIIERGQIDIISGNDEMVVQALGAGDIVGWSWLIPPYRWHFGAVTVSPVSAIMLDTDRLQRFMAAEPDLGYLFTRQVCAVLLRRLQASRYNAAEQRRLMRRVSAP